MRRLVLGLFTALVSINVWTGSPLLALWIGSRVQAESSLSMTAVFVVIVVLAALSAALLFLLSVLNAEYDKALGRTAPRSQAPWLRSMRGERDRFVAEKRPLSVAERIVIVSVVIAVLAFEVWFFFFAGSSIGHN